MQERLQKILAHAGVASRRHAEEMIQAGRVTVNGHIVSELGSKADPNEDVIKVDGKKLRHPERPLYILLNKPGVIPKVYHVKVAGQPTERALERLRRGPYSDKERLAPASIKILKSSENPWYEVTLHQGRNQQIRRMFQSIGHPVEKLRRVRIGSLEDDRLRPGTWRFLTEEEVNQFKR